MEQFKRAQVVMLSTNEKSILYLTDKLQISTKPLSNISINRDLKNQHLYIISDDEIKEDDWKYNEKLNCITQHLRANKNLPNNLLKPAIWCKKIIATTDTSLTTNFYHPNLGSNTKIILPQLSQQFIEKYIEEYNKGNVIKDVLVEYKELYNDYKETDIFDLVSTGHSKILKAKINPKDNTITIKKLKDSWNREEVIKITKKAWMNAAPLQKTNGFSNYSDSELENKFDNWIKENL